MKTQEAQEQMRAVGEWKDLFSFLCLPSKIWETHGGMIITPEIALKKPGVLQGQQKWLGAEAVGVSLLLKEAIHRLNPQLEEEM